MSMTLDLPQCQEQLKGKGEGPKKCQSEGGGPVLTKMKGEGWGGGPLPPNKMSV